MGLGETSDTRMSEALLSIGIGCKSGVSAGAVTRLVEAACSRTSGLPAGLFTAEDKRGEPALAQAATHLGLPLVYLPRTALKAMTSHTKTTSARVLALFGVPSIAETAALAGAGPGSRLVLARISAEGVTCAIAVGAGAALKETS